VFAVEAVGREGPQREKAQVFGISAAAAADVRNAALEEAIEHKEDMAHTVEAYPGCGMVEEEIVAGNSSRCRAACSHCTLALEGIVDSD